MLKYRKKRKSQYFNHLYIKDIYKKNANKKTFKFFYSHFFPSYLLYIENDILQQTIVNLQMLIINIHTFNFS
jgi:hypothetical protein